MYVLDGSRIEWRSDGDSQPVALVPPGWSLEQAALLVSKANLAARDESLLDRIADQISQRNAT